MNGELNTQPIVLSFQSLGGGRIGDADRLLPEIEDAERIRPVRIDKWIAAAAGGTSPRAYSMCIIMDMCFYLILRAAIEVFTI